MIVGMDWLFKRKFVIVCHDKVVRIPLEGDEILRVHGERIWKAAKALMNSKVDEHRISDIPVVRATPVTKSPYRLAPSKMQELSEQLREFQDKGFIRPSHFSRGAPVLYSSKQRKLSFLKDDFFGQVSHQLQCMKDAQSKDRISTRYVHFESQRLMPFGLTNANGYFHGLNEPGLQTVLRLSFMSSIFIDDNLAYSSEAGNVKTRLYAHAKRQGNRLCIETTEDLREELYHTQPRVGSCRVALKTWRHYLYGTKNVNVVVDALSRKDRVKSRQVRGMILAAQNEAFKHENVSEVKAKLV
ncbi:hypothetical protein Tco_1217401 [Tanacetum coccineum]